MPITDITGDEHSPTAHVKCPCGKVNTHPLADLQLGGSALETDQIVLPPCACGSREYLFRTRDGEDGPKAGHRKAVNAIGEWLKLTRRVHPDAAATIAAETGKPKLTRPIIGKV